MKLASHLFSPDAERSVLGAVMMRPSVLDSLPLTVADFAIEPAQISWRAVSELWTEGVAPDAVTVAGRLGTAPAADKVVRWLSEATLSVATADNVSHYAEILRQRRIARDVWRACTDTLKQLGSGGDGEDILASVLRSLESVAVDSAASEASAADAVFAELREVERDLQADRTPGVPTGLPALDARTGGIPNGVPTVLAARPSVGKTSLVLNMAVNAARAGRVVHFVTYEDRVPGLAQRLLARESGVSVSDIRGRTLTGEAVRCLTRAAGNAGPPGLVFEHAHGVNARDLARRVRAVKREHGTDLLVVDYLQLIPGEDRRANRFERVAQSAEVLAELVGQENLAAVICSQLNRDSAKSGRGPELHDLRDSGVIEQVAKLVLALHDGGKPDGDLWVHVLKNHQGPKAEFRVEFNRKECRIG